MSTACQRQRSTADAVVSLLLTALASLGFLWAAAEWIDLVPAARQDDPARMKKNEKLAYMRLKEIMAAQKRYKERDWDGDGKKTYASFYIHLWRSVDLQGSPVPVDLISRELGFSMVHLFALDGYVYRDIHTWAPLAVLSIKTGRGGSFRLDPKREWAVAAVPAMERRSGMIPLVAESSGAIWTQDVKHGPGGGGVPGAAGSRSRWIRVRSLQHLEEIQGEVPYPQAK